MENNMLTWESQIQLQKSNTYIIQLERYMNDVEQGIVLLNNYNYEPKTKELFELKYLLCNKFDTLLRKNKMIIQQLKLNHTQPKGQIIHINIHISALVQLQSDIKEYCGKAHNNSKIMA